MKSALPLFLYALDDMRADIQLDFVVSHSSFFIDELRSCGILDGDRASIAVIHTPHGTLNLQVRGHIRKPHSLAGLDWIGI